MKGRKAKRMDNEPWKEIYIMRKNEKCCVSCGKQDERTLKGYVQCECCASRTYEAQNKRRKRLSSEHRCISCGKQDERTLKGHTLCEYCVSCAAYTQDKRRKRLIRECRCTSCGKQDEKTLAGYCVCSKCRAKLDKYREKKEE